MEVGCMRARKCQVHEHHPHGTAAAASRITPTRPHG
jgi:hypothetical protein